MVVRRWLRPLGFCLGFALALLWSTPQGVLAEAKPKFFICPPGMVRDATVLTENYQVNLCSQEMAEISVVALRHRRTHQRFHLPVTTTDDVVYVAQGKRNTYTFDFDRRLLKVQPRRGRTIVEKILASD
jgi:hypothetical protein